MAASKQVCGEAQVSDRQVLTRHRSDIARRLPADPFFDNDGAADPLSGDTPDANHP